jgi:DNA primase
LDKAKMAIKSEDLAIMVEGQMDVITAHQSGFKNVVASSGTALTEDQIKLIKRYINNIALAFDMDKAGQMAADRGIREAMRAEMNIKVVMMPNGKDPDECIKNNPKEWVEAVAKARPIMEYYFDKVFAGLNLEEVQDKRKAAKEILPIIMKLGNKIEQGFWLRKLSEKIEIDENLLWETISAQTKSEVGMQKRQPETTEPQVRQSREEMLSELLLALAIKFPGLLTYAISHIQDDQIAGLLNKSFYKNLIIYYNEINNRQEADLNSAINYNNLKSWLEGSFDREKVEPSQAEKINRNQLKLLDRLVLLGDKDFYELDSEGAKREIAKISVILKKNYLMRRMREIEKTIGDYEEKGEGEKAGELLGELKMLSDEIREIGE